MSVNGFAQGKPVTAVIPFHAVKDLLEDVNAPPAFVRIGNLHSRLRLLRAAASKPSALVFDNPLVHGSVVAETNQYSLGGIEAVTVLGRINQRLLQSQTNVCLPNRRHIRNQEVENGTDIECGHKAEGVPGMGRSRVPQDGDHRR